MLEIATERNSWVFSQLTFEVSYKIIIKLILNITFFISQLISSILETKVFFDLSMKSFVPLKFGKIYFWNKYCIGLSKQSGTEQKIEDISLTELY